MLIGGSKGERKKKRGVALGAISYCTNKYINLPGQNHEGFDTALKKSSMYLLYI